MAALDSAKVDTDEKIRIDAGFDPMRQTLQISTALALGATLGWLAHQPSTPPKYSASRVICDQAHTAFDTRGNTYCQEIGPLVQIQETSSRTAPTSPAH